MYRIVGADQNVYGPISADQLRHWAREGRVNAHTQVQAAGTSEWQPLSAFPELADIAGTASPPAFGAAPAGSTPIQEILTRDYELPIGACLGNAWTLFKEDFGLLFTASLIYFGIEIGLGLLGIVPIAGALASIANLVIAGPLIGGLYYVTLRAIRREPAVAGDVFAGFRTSFAHLFLGTLIPGLITAACFVPAIIVGALTILPTLLRNEVPGASTIAIAAVAALICMLPALFLQVNWIFAMPLIIDRNMTFWPAMQTSWKMVMKHWWQVFGVLVLIGLVNVAGLLCCCVGVLFTFPIGVATLMYAYETIFSGREPQAV